MSGSHYSSAEDDEGANTRLNRPIALIGMMGAGKSTIGRRLATRLGVPFVDSDREVEEAAGRSINDIFADFGEAAFRDGERRVLLRLIQGGASVLATGGGSFLDDETRALMKEHCITVWLNADLDTLVERTSRRNTRPLLKNGNPRDILAALLAERGPTYGEARIIIESGGDPHDAVVNEIIRRLDELIEAGI